MNTISLVDIANATAASDQLTMPQPPRTVEDTGLPLLFLSELLCKILYLRGRVSLADLSIHVKLPVSVLDSVLLFMRTEHLCAVMSRDDNSASTIYQLSDTGRNRTVEYFRRNHYAGPAPVSLEAYTAQVQRQSMRHVCYTRERMASGFAGFVIQDTVMDQLGAAMNSGRAIIMYGPAGSGKTYIAENLTHLLSDYIAIPHALMVDNEVIQIFDPHVHQVMPQIPASVSNLDRKNQSDSRWVPCKRPIAFSGGELTLDTLELEFDDAMRFYQAPPHVKANNGLFVIDDLGRQRVSPQELMNRWIVPLGRGHDYLSLHTGYKFQIPFDVIVIFLSNEAPSNLADEAFLRRLGYKIEITALTEEQYRRVFRGVCGELAIGFSETVFQYLLHEYHHKENRPLLACYPRDLLGQIRDLALYEGKAPELNTQVLDWAWHNYFTTGQNKRRDALL